MIALLMFDFDEVTAVCPFAVTEKVKHYQPEAVTRTAISPMMTAPLGFEFLQAAEIDSFHAVTHHKKKIAANRRRTPAHC
jgi:hypothetical protein